jgi:hypothetical protein
MRRILMGLALASTLALGGGVALADGGPGGPGSQGGQGGPGGQGGWGTTGSTGAWGTTGGQGFQFPVPVVGTVVSADAGGNADSFVANAFVPGFAIPMPWGGGGNGGGGSGDQSSGAGFGQIFGSLFGSLFSLGSNTGLGSFMNGGSGLGSEFRSDLRSHDDGGGPATTQVTITGGDSTVVFVNGASGTVSGMSAGDEFIAFFDGSPGESITDLVQNAPLAIIDHTPPKPKELYAFVGTVSNVTTTDDNDGTVTVDVQGAMPSGIASSGDSVPLTVTSDTLILGGSSTTGLSSNLTDVSDNDIVVAGLVAPEGETLAQIEALPLKVLLDIPVSQTSGETQSQAREKALKKALAMIGDKVKSGKTKRTKHGKKSHRRSHSRHASRKHAHRAK